MPQKAQLAKVTPKVSKPSNFVTGLLENAVKKLKWPTVLLVVLFAGVFTFYYLRIPAEATVVVPGPVPPNLTQRLTENDLASSLSGSIQQIHRIAHERPAAALQLGIQMATPEAPYLLWKIPLPTYDKQVKGLSLNTIRQWAITAKVRHFVNVSAVTSSQDGFRLRATFSDRDFVDSRAFESPERNGACDRLDGCALELAEGILDLREQRTMILYHLNQRNETALNQVVTVYEKGIISTSQRTQADLYAWGDALRDLKRYDEAIAVYQGSLRLDPGLCAGYDAIGIAYLLKYASSPIAENLNAADRPFRQALECNPRDAVAHSDLGYILVRKWKASGYRDDAIRQQAVAENQKALEIGPDLVEPAVNLGYIQYMHGETTQALDYFRGITRKFPQSPVLFLNFGFLLYKEYLAGKKDLLEEAIVRTNDAWRLDQRSPIAAGNLAAFYYEAGSLSEAVGLWERAYQLDPNSPDILAGYALGLFKSGKQEKAILLYRQALGHDPAIKDPEHLRTAYFLSQKVILDMSDLQRTATSSDRPKS
jgi:tetratricopeptide (TPR) repeat protein